MGSNASSVKFIVPPTGLLPRAAMVPNTRQLSGVQPNLPAELVQLRARSFVAMTNGNFSGLSGGRGRARFLCSVAQGELPYTVL